MLKIYLTLLIGATLLLSADEPQQMIFHDNDYKLKWKDFQGKEEEGLESFDAVSYVGFTFAYKGTPRQDSLRIVVEAFFNKSRSWTDGDTTAKTLQHEQIHFDIAELYTRKLKQQITLATITYKNYQQVLKQLEGDLRTQMNLADSVYDASTDNGRNLTEQEVWNKNMSKDLSALHIYMPDTFTIPVKF